MFINCRFKNKKRWFGRCSVSSDGAIFRVSSCLSITYHLPTHLFIHLSVFLSLFLSLAVGLFYSNCEHSYPAARLPPRSRSCQTSSSWPRAFCWSKGYFLVVKKELRTILFSSFHGRCPIPLPRKNDTGGDNGSRNHSFWCRGQCTSATKAAPAASPTPGGVFEIVGTPSCRFSVSNWIITWINGLPRCPLPPSRGSPSNGQSWFARDWAEGATDFYISSWWWFLSKMIQKRMMPLRVLMFSMGKGVPLIPSSRIPGSSWPVLGYRAPNFPTRYIYIYIFISIYIYTYLYLYLYIHIYQHPISRWKCRIHELCNGRLPSTNWERPFPCPCLQKVVVSSLFHFHACCSLNENLQSCEFIGEMMVLKCKKRSPVTSHRVVVCWKIMETF